MEKIGHWLCDALLYEIKTGKTILVEVVLLAAGFSMLKNFSGTFEKNYVSDICFLLVYGVLCVLLLKSFEIYGTVAEEALNGSIDFMKALIPAFGISMVFSSGAESSARLLSAGVSGHLSGGVALSFGAASLHPCVCGDGAVQSLF